MTHPLIWNFECLLKPKLTLNLLETPKKDPLKWEARFFWPDSELICMNIQDESLENLTLYERKHKEDTYYLIPEKNYNVKQRGSRLLYKPITNETPFATGFGNKITLENLEGTHIETHPKPELLKNIFDSAKQLALIIPVRKESYTYKFPITPTIKLELVRVEVHNKIYYSACVEGRSHDLVKTMSDDLFGKRKHCDFVSFLISIS
ncbi:MAG: hypothetical protein ACHP6H_02030 [Legionellales bacterium]